MIITRVRLSFWCGFCHKRVTHVTSWDCPFCQHNVAESCYIGSD